MQQNSTSLATVIIPIHNNPKQLHIVLGALQTQTIANSQLQVCVVDNSTDPEVAFITKQYHAMYVVEKKQSSYAARNAGLAQANGEVIFFTDADCKPHTTWIEEGLKSAAAHSDSIIAGHITITTSAKPTVYELYEKATALNQKTIVATRHYGVTANVVIRHALLQRIGLFNKHLVSGGDMEWGLRAKKLGIKTIYAPTCIVEHPARVSYALLKKRTLRITNGISELALTSNTSLNKLSMVQNCVKSNFFNLVVIIGHKELSVVHKIKALLVWLTIQCLIIYSGILLVSKRLKNIFN